MVPNQNLCNQSQLQLLLEDRLSPSGRSKLTAHLDSCTVCCQRLEDLAAKKSWWDDAGQHLSTSKSDALLERDHSSEGGVRSTENIRKPLQLAEPINLDFLQPSDDSDAIGELGEYKILDVIGRGGMGIVLKGYDPELKRFVAVKVLAPHFASSGAARKRFARESRAAAAVVHQNVVPIYGVDTSGTHPYLVMPLVPGESLQEKIDREGPLDLDDVLRIAKQCADGLAAAHAQGLVHRDIKPANILLEMKVDRVLITDFGLARAADDAALTSSGMIAGTPPFMSPEQANGEPIDHRSDLFSLGSVIYTMCTGMTPFKANNTVAILRQISDMKTPSIRESNPAIPKWLVVIVEKLHAKQPKDRYASAGEVASILERCLAHTQHPDRIPLPKELTRGKAKRLLAGGVALLLMFAVVAIVVELTRLRSSTPFERPKSHNQNLTRNAPVTSDEPNTEYEWNAGTIEEELIDIETQIEQLEFRSHPSTERQEDR